MSLQTALTLFLEEYPIAMSRAFAGDSVAEFIRAEVPAILSGLLDSNPRYVCQGSPGQGVWARAPWAAVFDRFVTESAQDGYYLVYLAREDFRGAYLSLNQGVTSIRKQYGAGAKAALRVRASDFLARLGPAVGQFGTGEIDLASTGSTNLSAYYEAGSVCHVFYPLGKIPGDDRLATDLKSFIDLYYLLVSREAQLFQRADAEEDESDLGEEDLRRLREHKRIERNQSLAVRAKRRHGYICKGCGFDFEARYGALGKNFIEAHHLTPLSDLKGQRLTLDVKKDFTVLCANCHRMIHRSAFVNNVEEFRAQHVRLK